MDVSYLAPLLRLARDACGSDGGDHCAGDDGRKNNHLGQVGNFC